MNPNKYILLFEEFSEISEDLETRADSLRDKKAKMPDRMKSIQNQLAVSKQKINTFKEKAAKTADPLAKKIYTNRAAEEQMNQQILTSKAKTMLMQSKKIDSEINTTQLKITRKERDKPK
jgi:hypothetical protein